MAVILTAVIALPVRPVAAHAEPVSAEPPIDGVVTSAPAMVRVVFSEELAAEGSSLAVIGPDGTAVDNGDSTLDLSDMSRTTLTVTLKPGLSDGLYTVQWRTAASDGHTSEGSFTFTVGEAVDECTTPEAGTPDASPASDVMAGPDATPEASPDVDLQASPESCATPVAAMAGSLGSSDLRGSISGWTLLVVTTGMVMLGMIGFGGRIRLLRQSSVRVDGA